MTETVLVGDALSQLKLLQDNSIDCCVTSPPYFGLRDYGIDGQIGLEPTPDEYVAKLTGIFEEVKRVLKDDGTLWLNIGDSWATHGGCKNSKHSHNFRSSNVAEKEGIYRQKPYGKQIGLKEKDIIGIPWMVAFALRNNGYYLRQDIIWSKPNPMPEGVKDRYTKSHEYLFLFSKSHKYYFDYSNAQEPTVDGEKLRSMRSVWTIQTSPYKGAHFATFPPSLVEPCILAGCKAGGVVLDPFMGSGTTCMVAKQNGRGYIGIELNPEYVELAKKRICDGTKDGKQLPMAI